MFKIVYNANCRESGHKKVKTTIFVLSKTHILKMKIGHSDNEADFKGGIPAAPKVQIGAGGANGGDATLMVDGVYKDGMVVDRSEFYFIQDGANMKVYSSLSPGVRVMTGYI